MVQNSISSSISIWAHEHIFLNPTKQTFSLWHVNDLNCFRGRTDSRKNCVKIKSRTLFHVDSDIISWMTKHFLSLEWPFSGLMSVCHFQQQSSRTCFSKTLLSYWRSISVLCSKKGINVLNLKSHGAVILNWQFCVHYYRNPTWLRIQFRRMMRSSIFLVNH